MKSVLCPGFSFDKFRNNKEVGEFIKQKIIDGKTHEFIEVIHLFGGMH
jgi:hypothetical protein